jgi:hypothetical protein
VHGISEGLGSMLEFARLHSCWIKRQESILLCATYIDRLYCVLRSHSDYQFQRICLSFIQYLFLRVPGLAGQCQDWPHIRIFSRPTFQTALDAWYGISVLDIKRQSDYVRFEVFTAMTTNNAVFWDVTQCGFGKNWRFRRTYRLHHQRNKNRGDRTNVSRN